MLLDMTFFDKTYHLFGFNVIIIIIIFLLILKYFFETSEDCNNIRYNLEISK